MSIHAMERTNVVLRTPVKDLAPNVSVPGARQEPRGATTTALNTRGHPFGGIDPQTRKVRWNHRHLDLTGHPQGGCKV